MTKIYTKRDNEKENFFAQLKQYRAIATRYDKRAINFVSAIYLAAAVIWLN
jgi:transposase